MSSFFFFFFREKARLAQAHSHAVVGTSLAHEEEHDRTRQAGLGDRRHHHGRIRAHVKCTWLAPTTWLRLASNLRLIARLFLLLMG